MRITTLEELLEALDELFDDGADLTRRGAQDPWERVFSQPGHPLASDLPDACLVDWTRRGLLPSGDGLTALDLGCGLGRNARWLARQGYAVTGLDLSPYAIGQAREQTSDPNIRYLEGDVLRDPIPGGPFDVVYDSGCFHHLPPHRRLSYLHTLRQVLKPGGWFGLCTFAWGQMGSEKSDVELLRQGQLEGGVGYTLNDLRQIFGELDFVTGGPLSELAPAPEPVFQMDFLQAALFRRPEEE